MWRRLWEFFRSLRFHKMEIDVVEQCLRPYDEFRDAVGMRESSDNYKAKNSFGYLGRYQFGLARLTDLTLCVRKPGTKGWGNSSFTWQFPFTEEAFLSSKELQDACFDEHVRKHALTIKRRYGMWENKTVHGISVTTSGMIACFHLLGEGGFRSFLDDKPVSDANGTSAVEYIKLFEGFCIPDNLPWKSNKDLQAFLATKNIEGVV